MQQAPMTGPAAAQQQLAAMMWQMQMASPYVNPATMMPPWAPQMPVAAPTLSVRVEGLKFEYQLTDDDVRKVFARYGEVRHVGVDKDGTAATVQLEHPHQAVSAQSDLDRKQLSGMAGAFLRVEFAPQLYDPALQMAAAAAAQSFAGQPPPAMTMMQPSSVAPPPPAPGSPGVAGKSRPKKNTCKLEVGIENEGEFRVGSRVISIARQIWQDAEFQKHGGKTRLRGKGIGGPHEADEPLALCISCSDHAAFEKATRFAEAQLQKVHNEYRAFCQQNDRPIPELAVKVSRKGSGRADPTPAQVDVPRGERPANAPSDDEIERLIEERNEARKAQNFTKADELREFLKQRGVVLMDEKAAKGNLKGKEVTKWRFWRS
eukprot:TRINITY_DN15057_c0_g1_i1.p1 TRINITY_DN15057_c0_g1~~TRINITY_DN15057_c0_g1_i1.p1  ORF type:complete len:375 (-),score=98.50 TRINITY_DN15057_c0_g1_i1:198-1322(-)